MVVGLTIRVLTFRVPAFLEDKAERALPIPEHAANDLSTNAGVTVEQLRGQLDRIMKAEG